MLSRNVIVFMLMNIVYDDKQARIGHYHSITTIQNEL